MKKSDISFVKAVKNSSLLVGIFFFWKLVRKFIFNSSDFFEIIDLSKSHLPSILTVLLLIFFWLLIWAMVSLFVGSLIYLGANLLNRNT